MDANSVYWIEGTTVNRFPRNPSQGATVGAAGSSATGLSSLRRHDATNRLFWAAGNQIVTANAGGSNATALVADRPGTIVAMFISGNSIYWAENAGALVNAFTSSVNGGPIASLGSASANPRFVGGAAGCVLFIDEVGGPSVLWRMCDGGNALDVPFQGPGEVRHFHADDEDLFVSAGGQGVVRLDTPVNLSLVSSTQEMGEVETDDTFVYFVHGSGIRAECIEGASISRIEKAGGTSEDLATDLGCVSDIAVDGAAVHWADPIAGEIWKLIVP